MANETEDEGPMVTRLPRFSYQLPPDLTQMFVSEMARDHRESPSDLITAVLRRYFEARSHAQVMAKLNAKEGLEAAEQRIPYYGPKPAKSEVGQETKRKTDEA
jgi:hypothetical protein